jgi:hypothetical protein
MLPVCPDAGVNGGRTPSVQLGDAVPTAAGYGDGERARKARVAAW